ncbi:peptidoglycan-binding protein [Flavimaricola marinus]|uniref:Putative peptidoglycan binding domain protein n=1 Tax=Flavimaricola marinus TaxID=1819565 RepID=A0A238LHZ2_9RHOB|nr:peptidoglycan-binding protein [Flavimaricola marinus]SMY09015.1 Putative peptidoglycan binding domain protein [Flavimaricola marinus]
MRHFISATAIAMLASASWAEDAALVLGIERYEELGRLVRGAEPVDAASSLEEMGFDVVAIPNPRASAMADALAEFAENVQGADRLVVILSGRFVTDGGRTWFMAANAEEPSLLSMQDGLLSVDSVMHAMSGSAGEAILLLGVDSGEDAVFDAWLTEGIGALDIPQGVTVLRGLPRDIADFAQVELVEPEADLTRLIAANRRISASGYLPRAFAFMGPVPEQPVDEPTVEVDPAAEQALWEGALALDTAEAFRNYLTRYPNGEFIAQAEEKLAAILSEPNRADRLAEEALQLTRDERRDIQRNLSLLDYNTRGIDGIFGPGTRGAITNWQQVNGYSQTSYLTTEQINQLDAQAARRAAELEAEAERLAAERARLDRAFWEETGARGDEPGYRAYLERYPDGLFAETATEALDAIEEEKRRAAEAEDRAAWDVAREADTQSSYADYLTAFPSGVFKAEAEARLAELQRESSSAGAEQQARAAEEALNLNVLTARLVEAKLDSLDLNPGAVDGRFDDDTRRAIRRYQGNRDLPVSGYLDEGTLVRLLADTIGSLR